jgi:hypothetical protein
MLDPFEEVQMKKRILIITVTLLMLSLLFSPVKAQAPTTFESSVQIRNLEGTSGKITLSFINADGSTAGSATIDILGSETLSFYRSTLPIASGFSGSIVISSDVRIAGMSNIDGLNISGVPVNYAAFSAFDQGATTAYLPTLFYNNYGYNTFYSVQNLGTANADFTVNYSDGTTKTVLALKPGAAAKVDQLNEGFAHTKPVFAGTLTSNQPVAVNVIENGKVLFAYNGFSSGSTRLSMPLINENNYGYSTGVQIMNIGTVPTTITVRYSATSVGTSCQESRTVTPGSSKTFAQHAFFDPYDTDPTFTTDCIHGALFVGSGAVITNSAEQPLVATVNQFNPTSVKGGAYGAFNPAAGGTTVIFPLIMDRVYGYFTSWSLTNVGTTTIPIDGLTCTVTGKDKLGTPIVRSFKNPKALAQNDGWTELQNNQLGDQFLGAAVCIGPAGSKLVGTANELGNGPQYANVDSLLVYEGIIQP